MDVPENNFKLLKYVKQWIWTCKIKNICFKKEAPLTVLEFEPVLLIVGDCPGESIELKFIPNESELFRVIPEWIKNGRKSIRLKVKFDDSRKRKAENEQPITEQL